VHVLFEERRGRRRALDVMGIDGSAKLLQKTSGVATSRSSGLPVHRDVGHRTSCSAPLYESSAGFQLTMARTAGSGSDLGPR